MRKWVVGSEVQLEEGILLRRVSPERPLYGRLAAEGVDRFADGLGANVSGIFYGVEVGGWELTRRCTFLCVDRTLHFKDFGQSDNVWSWATRSENSLPKIAF